MASIPLQTVPEPEASRSTLVREGEGTVVFDGDYAGPTYVCGGCGAPLMEGVLGSHVIDLVLSCNACGAYNEAPSANTSGLESSSVDGPVTFPPGHYALSGPITVHERFVMASSRALRGRHLGTPVEFTT